MVHAPTVDPTMEPNETYRVAPITGVAHMIAARPAQGESTVSEAQPEAIPFPP